ncbi:uncharacterized protein LOC125485040 [Rhincodon typus]|uniref:uncharacterized protein LOC125485040 n=1 Tax=Rhincodon typus TaxID=259920 RepID=UPI00202E3005|nr:uncharacterized protein LOC125485040 [Rhincodon typus]
MSTPRGHTGRSLSKGFIIGDAVGLGLFLLVAVLATASPSVTWWVWSIPPGSGVAVSAAATVVATWWFQFVPCGYGSDVVASAATKAVTACVTPSTSVTCWIWSVPPGCAGDAAASAVAIAEAIQTQGKRSEFLKLDAETAISWLLSQESGEAGQTFQNFLKKHGFRCLREAELHEKSWRSDPIKLFPAIQRTLQREKVFVEKVALSPDEAIGSIKSSVTWIRKCALRLILPDARKAIADRELLKAEAIKMNDVFKVAYWKLAKLMVVEVSTHIHLFIDTTELCTEQTENDIHVVPMLIVSF